MNEYIKSRLSEEMILGQLMEECAAVALVLSGKLDKLEEDAG